MRKSSVVYLILSLFMILSLVACGSQTVNESVSPSPAVQTETPDSSTPMPAESANTTNEVASADTGSEASLPIQSDLRFVFTSGAGGWRTLVTVHPDGSFEGDYYDSNGGESGDGYDSTSYVCEFSGTFGNIRKVNEYIYSMQVTSITQQRTTGTEEIMEETTAMGDTYRVRQVYSDPYGMTGVGGNFEFYLLGTPVELLPGRYLEWIHGNASYKDQPSLPYYGLYNVDQQLGMYSSEDDF